MTNENSSETAPEGTAPTESAPPAEAPVVSVAPPATVTPAAPSAPERKPWETWATAKKLAAWQLAAARYHARWPVGQEVSEAVFDAAVKTATTSRIG